MKNKNECRIIIDFSKIGINIFEEFGKYNYVNTQEKLKMHTHNENIEICYLAKGSQEYIIENERFRIYGGDLFISFPNELHGSGNLPEEKGCLYWMTIKPPTPEIDYLGLKYEEAIILFSSIANLPSRVFKGSKEYEKTIQNIINIFQKKEITQLDILEIKNLIIHLFILIIRLGNKNTSESNDKRIDNIIKYINQNIFDSLYISDLADKCYLSESRFKHFFKEVTGIPPAEYIIRQKIKKAEELLSNNEYSIKDIAYDLGFSSPAYFSTVFKQYTGYSPTQHKEYIK